MESYRVYLSWLSFDSRNRSGDNQQSRTSMQESVIVNVPENLDTDKMIPVECLSATNIPIPPPDYDVDTTVASENISFHTNPSPSYSHGSFSRNSDCEDSREACNGKSVGYSNTTIYGLSNENHEESVKHNVNTDAEKNNSLNYALPLVHLSPKSCQNNSENIDADKMIPVECLSATELPIPPPDYDVDTPASLENISFRTNPSPGHPSAELSPHGSFSRNSDYEASRETCNSTSAEYNTIYGLSNENPEESLKHNVNIDTGKNKSLNHGLPLVHFTSKSCLNNAFSKETKFYTFTKSTFNNSASILPGNYECGLDDNCALPKSQDDNYGDRKYSLYEVQSQLGKESDLKELRIIPGRGVNLDSESMCVIKDRGNINGDTKLPSFQTQRKITSYINRYSETDAANRMKNGERRCELIPCKEMNPSSLCRWNSFRIPQRDPQLLLRIAQSAHKKFYHNANLPPTLHRIPVPVQDNLCENHVKSYQLNSHSSFLQNEPATNSGALLPMLMKDRRSISPEKLYFSVISRLKKPHMPRHIHMRERIPRVHLSLKQVNPYRVTFLKNKSKVTMQTNNNSSVGHISDNESIYGSSIYENDNVLSPQMEKCGAVSMTPHFSGASCSEERLSNPTQTDDDDTVSYYSITDGCSLYAHRGTPEPTRSNMYDRDQVFDDQRERYRAVSTVNHIYQISSSPEVRPDFTVETDDDKSVSYYSVTDGCSLYGHRGSPIPQSFSDMDIPVPDSRGLTEQKCSKHSVKNLGYEAQLYPPMQANGNKGIYDSNPQFSARYSLDASTYFVNDARNNRRDEQTKCCQCTPGNKETSLKTSTNDKDISGQSEPICVRPICNGSPGDSRMIQISMNIPTTTENTIISCLSESPVADADGDNLTDRTNEIPSPDLASRCFLWKCDPSQVIMWLAILFFCLAMLVYVVHEYTTPVSPLVWVFLIALILTVFLGFVRSCRCVDKHSIRGYQV